MWTWKAVHTEGHPGAGLRGRAGVCSAGRQPAPPEELQTLPPNLLNSRPRLQLSILFRAPAPLYWRAPHRACFRRSQVGGMGRGLVKYGFKSLQPRLAEHHLRVSLFQEVRGSLGQSSGQLYFSWA